MRNYRRSEGAIVGAEETVERLADELLRTPSQYLRERLVAAEAALSELRGGEREVNARIAATGASLVDSRAERFRLAVHAWTPGEDAAGANAALRQLVSG
jgi:hypothetical protein